VSSLVKEASSTALTAKGRIDLLGLHRGGPPKSVQLGKRRGRWNHQKNFQKGTFTSYALCPESVGGPQLVRPAHPGGGDSG